jgi:hypothetical protein
MERRFETQWSIEAGLRGRVRDFIEAMVHGELDPALARPRYGRRAKDEDGVEDPAGMAEHSC